MTSRNHLADVFPFVLLVFSLCLGCPGGDDDDDATGDDDTSADDDATGDDDTTGDDDATGDDDTTGTPGQCYDSCEDILASYQPCGGDLLGAWEFVQFCGAPHELAILGGDCPEEDQHRAFYAFEGTVTFDATAFTNEAFELGFVYMTDVPTACIPAPYSCETLADDLQATLGLESGGCVDTGDRCECLLCSGTMPATSSQEHDYSLNGDIIIEDGQDAGSYCVDGNTLTLHMYEGTEFEHVLILSRM
jgi:hypothetical protein